ncbi:hypothetical protein [Agaribacterium haliotis]|uniref:hypothetical protein n=1 Tax=Agaribacterium haliotis TaxID=2013869 RepID=UPI000BB54E4F|nr:hypothetical protein [Agaribacterium haliotis]
MNNLKKTSLSAAGIAALVLSSTLSANEQQQQLPLAKNVFVAAIGQIGIDSESADNEYIDDSAMVIRLGWERESSKQFLFGLGVNFYSYDDKASTSARVVDAFGNESTKDSSAGAMGIYGEAGYLYRKGVFEAKLVGGIDLMFASERSIPNCTDCGSEKIDLSSGFYLRPELGFRAANGFGMGLAYTGHLGGDLTSGLSLTASYQY